MTPVAVDSSNTAERTGMSLSLEGVTTYLRFGRELKSVISRVDLRIEPGEIVGLVGESGSGKSMTARTIAGVLPRGAVTEGALLLGGENLLEMPRRRRRDVQAKEIGVIFQDPRAYIDPLWRVEVHMTEAMRVHLGLSRSEARARAIELLDSVGIDQPERRMRQFPDELSGGMLQRVMIAGALAVGPSVLLADEATTALDVTTQAEIVKLLGDLSSRRGLSVLFITHDLALADLVCSRVCVMYAGRIVEMREGRQIFENPMHPYTIDLLAGAADDPAPRGAAPGHQGRSHERHGRAFRMPLPPAVPLRLGRVPRSCAGADAGAGGSRPLLSGQRGAQGPVRLPEGDVAR